MHWMQAERIIYRLGLNSSALKKEKLAIAKILITDRCRSLLKVYHPDTGIEKESKKFQEISKTIELVEKYGVPTIYKALHESPKTTSERKEILAKVDEKLTGSLQSSSMINISELKNIFESGKYFLEILQNAKNHYVLITNVDHSYHAQPITLDEVVKDKRMRGYLNEELIKIGKEETRRKLKTIEDFLPKNKENRRENIEQEREEKISKGNYSALEETLKKSQDYFDFQERISKTKNKETEAIEKSVKEIVGSFIWKKTKEIKKEIDKNKDKNFYGLDLLLKENFAECFDYKDFQEKFNAADNKEYQKINEFLIANLTKGNLTKIKEKLADRISRKKELIEARLVRLQEEINLSYETEIKQEKEKERLKNLDIAKEYTIAKRLDKLKNPLKTIERKIKENSTPEEKKLFETRKYSSKFIGYLNKPRYSSLASIHINEELNISHYVFRNLSDKFIEKNGNYEPTNRKIFGIINSFDLEKYNLEKINTLQLKGKENEKELSNLVYKETMKKLYFFNSISNNPKTEHIGGNYSLISVEFNEEGQPIYRIEGIVASNFFKKFSEAITRNSQK